MSEKKYRGFVKWMSKSKGYGFITPDNSVMGDIFVHCSDCEFNETYEDGQEVVFNIVEDERGKKAINVKRVG